MTEKVLVALFSVAVGALLGGAVNAMVGRYASFKESQAVAAALRAEIEVVLAVIERRDHVAGLGRTISHLSIATGPPARDDFYGTMGGTQDAYSVFHANCGRIGLLGSAAESVVAAYLRFKAVDADLSSIPERHQRLPLTRPQLLQAHQGARDLLLDAIARAGVAVTKLQDHERRRFLRCRG